MLGPTRIERRGVVRQVGLRPPANADAQAWVELVRADEKALRPWWPTKEGTWEERVTQEAWFAHRGRLCRAARRGFAVPMAVVVNGRFVGEMILDRIDRANGTAELGGWISSTAAGAGVGAAALELLLTHGFGPIGLRRITAPIAVGNRAAAALTARFGFRREGILRDHLHVNGAYQDHALWAALAQDFANRTR